MKPREAMKLFEDIIAEESENLRNWVNAQEIEFTQAIRRLAVMEFALMLFAQHITMIEVEAEKGSETATEATESLLEQLYAMVKFCGLRHELVRPAVVDHWVIEVAKRIHAEKLDEIQKIIEKEKENE